MELRKIIDEMKLQLHEIERAIEIFEGLLVKKQAEWDKRCLKVERKKTAVKRFAA